MAVAGRLLAGLLLLAAPSTALAQARTALDEARVEALIEACGERDIEAYLAERLARHGLDAAPDGLDRSLERPVDRALDPANNPERAADLLAALMARDGAEPAGRRSLGYYVLRTFAFHEQLNCQALRQWFGHLVIYRDLAAKAAEDDPNQAYYDRSMEQFRTKLAIMLRARDRLAEKEARALAAVGLDAP